MFTTDTGVTEVHKFFFKDNSCEGSQLNRRYFDFDPQNQKIFEVPSNLKFKTRKYSSHHYKKLLSSSKKIVMVRYDTRNFRSYLRRGWRKMFVTRTSVTGVEIICENNQQPIIEKSYRYDRFIDIKNIGE